MKPGTTAFEDALKELKKSELIKIVAAPMKKREDVFYDVLNERLKALRRKQEEALKDNEGLLIKIKKMKEKGIGGDSVSEAYYKLNLNKQKCRNAAYGAERIRHLWEIAEKRKI